LVDAVPETRISYTALAARFKRPFNLEGAQSLLRAYEETERIEQGDDGLELVSKAEQVSTRGGEVHFTLRWDTSFSYLDGDEPRLARQTNRARVCLREGPTGPMAFVYANLTTAPTAAPHLSRALFRLQGQASPFVATQELFEWVLSHDVYRILQGGFKITGIQDLKYVSLNGEMNPATNPDWIHYQSQGQLRSLTYENRAREGIFAIHVRGMYSISGDGLSDTALEEYFLQTVAPHL
jgi:hypothetical protein